MNFERASLQKTLAGLAAKGIFVDTSSWKYPAWRGMIYDEWRYVYRGKFAGSRFEKNCLTEYAETFKSGCVDAGYYCFSVPKYISGLVSQVPDDFLSRSRSPTRSPSRSSLTSRVTERGPENPTRTF